MSRGTRLALFVALIATLAVKLIAMLPVDAAGLGDPNYYEDIAQSFARGEGLTSRCAWNLMHLPDTLPAPGCAYWGPGVPLIAGLAHTLFGPSVRAAQGAMIALSMLLAALAVLLASRALTSPAGPVFAGLLIAFHLQLTFFAVTVDTPVPFAVAANLALLPLASAHAGWAPGYFLALPGALAAQLTRADGLLLPALVFGFALAGWWRGRLSARALVLMLALYVAGWSVWLVRNERAFGTPFPSSMAEGVLLRDYSDLFRIHSRPSLARFLELGPAKIISERFEVLIDNLGTALFAENLLLVACAALALPALVRDPRAAPFLAYLVALIAAMTLAFPQQSRFGSLLHSLPALFPFLVVSALLGIERGLARIAEWPKGRGRWLARTLFTLAPALLVVYSGIQVLGGALSEQHGLATPFRELAGVRRTLQAWWARPGVGGPDVRLMSNDSLDLLGMLPAPVVQEPRDPGVDAVFELAARYRLRYFVVFRIPRYKTGAWDRPEYTHALGRLLFRENLPATLAQIQLDGIAIYEFCPR